MATEWFSDAIGICRSTRWYCSVTYRSHTHTRNEQNWVWVCRTFYRKNLARLFYGLFCMPLGCLHVVACVQNIWMKLKRTPFFGRSIFSFPLTASEMSLKLSFVTKAYLRRVRSIFFFIYNNTEISTEARTSIDAIQINQSSSLSFRSDTVIYRWS